MENTKPFFLDAKKALIGGSIAIILSPVSIILAYYLGQQLERPKLTLTNIEQQFTVVSASGSNNLALPDSVVNPLKMNIELSLLTDLDATDFENQMSKEEVSYVLESLGDANLAYDLTLNLVMTNIKNINSWDGKSELLLEFMNPELFGGKTLYSLAKEDPKGALQILRGISLSAEKRKREIERFVNYVTPFINDKTEKLRTGDLNFIVGILNSGKTDAVIFPKGELSFQDKIIYFTAKSVANTPGYSVINSHSFKQIIYKLESSEGNAKDIEEWKAMVKNHASAEFKFKVKSIESEITYSSNLETK
ncbi:MAG: hypothetical protein IPM92_04055 [Saprospiraceae bacterium]|nr:hypothetical protein [Saprospiraceae bacterium]